MASLDDLAVKRGAVDNGEFSDDSGADSAKDSFNESDFDDTDTDAITELDANAEIEVLDRQAEECDLAVRCTREQTGECVATDTALAAACGTAQLWRRAAGCGSELS